MEQERDFDRDDQGQQEKRFEWFYNQRAYPFDLIPPGARLRAWNQRKAMEDSARASRSRVQPAGSGAATAGSPVWSFIGPQDNAFWNGNSSGRITALAVDPRNSQVVWAGAADGGVWKSTDGGGHWTPLTDSQASLSTGAIALDPSNPDTIYVGTGEANQGSDNYGGIGILKSVDGGATWINYPGRFTRGGFGRIAVHPTNPQVLLAGAYGGIFRSEDGGMTWSNVLQGSLGTAVAWNRANPTSVLAGIGYAFGDSSNGVYRSGDAGSTWTRIAGTGLPPASETGRVEIAVAPSNPAVVYAGIGAVIGSTNNPTGSMAGSGVYGSTDGGESWALLAQPGYDPNWYENTLAVSPLNPFILVGGGSPLSVSSDGGKTWTHAGSYIHPDQHAVAFSADGSIVYAGNDGGVVSTIDPTAPSATWNALNSTLGVTQFYPGFSISPSDLNVAIGGTQDNGTLLYGGLPLWNWINCGDGGATAIDPTNPTIMYVACITGPFIVKSTDGGATNQPASEGLSTTEGFPWPPSIAIAPSDPSDLYYLGERHVYQTTDAAGSWQPISGDLTDGESVLTTVSVAPADSNTVYVGTGSGVVQVTRNALAGMSSVWMDRALGLPNRWVNSIVVDGENPEVAYVGFSGFGSGHIFETTDAGESWTDISLNLPDTPVNDIALDPDLAGTIYVGTDVGVFATSNAGGPWSVLGMGLPGAVVTGTRFHHLTRTLRVSTHGRGMWDLALPIPPVQLASGGIVNAASYGLTSGTMAPNAAVAPGSIATAFGASMTNVSSASATALPLPTSLGGESLTIAGIAAPQFFASRQQLNIQIPWEVPPGTQSAALSVGTSAVSGQVVVVSYLPGIFTADSSGQGQGIIVHPGTLNLAAPTGAFGSSTPAQKGETLTLYATGLGPVDHQPPTGAGTPVSPLANTTTNPVVTVGGAPANVTFSGLTPGLVGLYQVNFQAPQQAIAGDSVPVVLSIGGAISNQVTMAIAIPITQPPAGGYSQNCDSPTQVPFPVDINGTLVQNGNDCFSINVGQGTNVQFSLTGSGGFQGWLFVHDPELSPNYIYVTGQNGGVLDAMLGPGTWAFAVSWNTDSQPGPYQLVVQTAPPSGSK